MRVLLADIVLSLMLVGCGDPYQQGYNDGYIQKPSQSSNQQYQDGYAKGKQRQIMEKIKLLSNN